MKTSEARDPAVILRHLPSVDSLLRSPSVLRLSTDVGARHITEIARVITNELRGEIAERVGREAVDDVHTDAWELFAEAVRRIEAVVQSEQRTGIRRVINATGVVIHTNLGRAPLSENAKRAIVDEASGYCTVEFDLESGKRGKRGERVENLLKQLTGAEEAIVVNNCAAAAFLVLTVLASGGEVVISRGELVEIGGDFRVPDVLEQSGAKLREVGTTNRTKLADYEKAVGENTRVILRVHPSNYRIIGFTAMPTLAELADLARSKEILLYEDAGSGAVSDMLESGLSDEPIVSESIAAGADVVTFSGDKLLGGPQAGMIVGRGKLIEKIRKHPLYRALRVDKLIYAALEATLESHLREAALQEIPVLKMVSQTNDKIAGRTREFAKRLGEKLRNGSNLKFEIIEGRSAIGGGAAPAVQPQTTIISLRHDRFSVDQLEERLRSSQPPIIARIADERVLIDLRTVSSGEENELFEILISIA